MASFKYIYELISAGKLTDNVAKALINVFEGLDTNLENALKSGDDADLQKFQEDAVRAADNSGDIQAKQYLDNPRFLDFLKEASQIERSFDEMLDAVRNGNDIDFSAFATKYPDINIDGLKQDFEGINKAIKDGVDGLVEQHGGKAGEYIVDVRKTLADNIVESGKAIEAETVSQLKQIDDVVDISADTANASAKVAYNSSSVKQISRQMLGVIKSPEEIVRILDKELGLSPASKDILKELSPKILDAIQDGNVTKWIEDTKVGASDEKLAILNSPDFQAALHFGERLDAFAIEFGDKLFKGDNIDLDVLAAKHKVTEGNKSAYDVAVDVLDTRNSEIDERAGELAQVKGEDKADYMGQAKDDWVVAQKEHQENGANVDSEQPSTASASAKATDNSTVGARYVFSDGSNKLDTKFEEDYWASLRGNGKFNPNDPAYEKVSKETFAAVADMGGRLGVEVSNEAEKLLTSLGGKIEDHAKDALQIWLNKVDPAINPNAAKYTAGKFDIGVESSLRVIFKPNDDNQELIDIARNSLSGMHSAFKTAIRSGEEADLELIQRRLIRDSKKAGNTDAEAHFANPNFLKELNVLSQATRFEDDYWKALEQNTSLKVDAKQYKDLDPAFITQRLEDFKQANTDIEKRAKSMVTKRTADEFVRDLNIPETNALKAWLNESKEANKTPAELMGWMKDNQNTDTKLAGWMSDKKNAKKLNNGLEERKTEDFIDHARKYYVSENNPAHVKTSDSDGAKGASIIDKGKLPEYKEATSKSSGLPKFKPKFTFDKLISRVNSIDTWRMIDIKAIPAKAFPPMSKGNVEPVIKYVDQAMQDTGLIKSLQDLEANILKDYKKGDVDTPTDLINDFAEDNLENLTRFRDKIQELKDHVLINYKTNMDRFGSDMTRNHDDLITEQKEALIKLLDTYLNMAGDLSKGIEGKNGQEMLASLKKIDDGKIGLKKYEESITGTFHANYLANQSSTTLTSRYPKNLGGGKANQQFIEMRARQIDAMAYYGGPHTSKPMSKSFLVLGKNSNEGGDNNEFLVQNRILDEYSERDLKTGKSPVDWRNDKTADGFLSKFVHLIKEGAGHDAVFVTDMLARLKQKPGIKETHTLPEISNFNNAVARIQADHPKGSAQYDFYHGDEFEFYVDKMRKRIEKEESRSPGRNDITALLPIDIPMLTGINRQTQFNAITNLYPHSFATRYGDRNYVFMPKWLGGKKMATIGGGPLGIFNINLPGVPVPFLRVQSLPGGIEIKSHLKFRFKQPLKYINGEYEFRAKPVTQLSRDTLSFEPKNVIQQKVNKEAGETAINQWTRRAARLPSGFMLDDLVKPGPKSFKKSWDEDFNKWNPFTYAAPVMSGLGLKTTAIGSGVIGTYAAFGLGSGYYNSDTENDPWWAIAGDTAWGGFKGGASVFTTLKFENDGWLTPLPSDIEFGTPLKLGTRLTVGVVDSIFTDGLIGGNLDGVRQKFWGDGNFLDFDREDDGLDLTELLEEKYPSMTYSSILFGHDEETKKPTSPKKDGEAEEAEVTTKADDLATARIASNENVQIIKDKVTSIGDGFALLLTNIDELEAKKIIDINAYMKNSASEGKTDEVLKYTELKSQLQTSMQGFVSKVNEDEKKSIVEIDKILQQIGAKDATIQTTNSLSLANKLLTEQDILRGKLDAYDDMMILRQSEINVAGKDFGKAVDTASVIAITPAPVVVDPNKNGTSSDDSDDGSSDNGSDGVEVNTETPVAKKPVKPTKPLEPWEVELNKDKADAAKTLVAINKDVRVATAELVGAKDYVRAMAYQSKKIETVRKDVLANYGAPDREARVQRLNDLLVMVNENRQNASDMIAPLQEEKDQADEIAKLAKEINGDISKVKDFGEVGVVKTKLDELHAQAKLSKVARDEADKLNDQILLFGQTSQGAMDKNDDYSKAYANDAASQLDGGIRVLSGGKDGLIYQAFGGAGDDGPSYASGLFNTAAGGIKKFSGWWDELERNTKSKEERNWLLGIKAGGLFLGGMVIMNTINDLLMGGKMGKGWKISILVIMAGYLLNKTGEWGDKMAGIEASKTPFMQGNSSFKDNGTSKSHTPSAAFSTDPNKSKGSEESNVVPIRSSNPNAKPIKNIFVDVEKGTVQLHRGGMPSNGDRDIIISDELKKATLDRSQGTCKFVPYGQDTTSYTSENIKSEDGKIIQAEPVTVYVTGCDAANDPANVGKAANQ